ncbi:class I SAM-dependent methyltransferase [Planococcus sp. 107-1]|uniref:class I SAM-dependent methyltransferase n=1 Tax=Planococcus sp. 107-1 TaxID=2908840 RepID=UPI0028832049|nr:class I SAM-dependent methyltransferase [Planococcus sp. 107-1]
MNNYWNKIIYKLWSPVYDIFFNAGPFLAARKNVFHGITINPQQQVLVVGVGTGADLELLDLDGMEITAIDYSEDMLNQARKKFKDSSIQFIEMDAQQMTFADNQFDVVIGILILSVVPHAEDCFKEMERVLKPGGEILLFDKFLPREKSSHFLKK